MGRKYVPVILRGRFYKVYESDLNKIHISRRKKPIPFPRYNESAEDWKD
jgi:hypothetical protein